MKKTICTVIIAFFTTIGFSQKTPVKPIFENVVFQNGDSIIVQKSLPVYVSISTSKDGKLYELKSTQNPADANPMYLDTEGINYIRSRWAVDPETKAYKYPKREVLMPVYGDAIVPKTILNFSAAPKYISNKTVFYGVGLSYSLRSSDAVSGVQNIYHTLDDAYAVYDKDNVVITKEGENSLYYFSVDNVGNAEETKISKFTYDITAPETHFSKITRKKMEYSNGYVRGRIYILDSIFVSGTENLDSKAILAYSGLKKGKQIAIPSAEFDKIIKKLWSLERFNSIDFGVSKTVNDKVALEIKIKELSEKVDDKEIILGLKTHYGFYTDDKISGVKKMEYVIDGGAVKSYTKPINFNFLNEGNHKISFYATDNVKNQETPKSLAFFLDKSPPNVTISYDNSHTSNDTVYVSGLTDFQLDAFDNKAGVNAVYYKINNADYIVHDDEPFQLDSYDGPTSLKYYGVDNVENSSKDNEGLDLGNLFVDRKAPMIQKIITGPHLTLRDTTFVSPKTKIGVVASDGDGSGVKEIKYLVDDTNDILDVEDIKKMKVYDDVSRVGTQDLDEGNHAFTFYAIDKVANQGSLRIPFFSDNNGPEIKWDFGVKKIGSRMSSNGTSISIYPKTVVVFLYATDDYVGYKEMFYKINGGKEIPYSKSLKSFEKGKDYKIEIRALDNLGNESTNTFSFGVD